MASGSADMWTSPWHGHAAERSLGMVMGTERQELRESTAPQWAASAHPTILGQECASLSQVAVWFLSLSYM